jgi:hypothetical protein
MKEDWHWYLMDFQILFLYIISGKLDLDFMEEETMLEMLGIY